MSNTACATLLLLGIIIDEDETQFGWASNSARSELEWYNINLRTLLGDLYDKYDTFNLCLTSISCAKATEPVGGTYLANNIDNAHLTIYISGLPFINQTYSVTNKCNTREAPIGVFTYPTNQTSLTYRVYNDAGVITFGKSQELCNIHISLRRVVDDVPPESANGLPTTNFLFSIFGVDKKDSNNGSRI